MLDERARHARRAWGWVRVSIGIVLVALVVPRREHFRTRAVGFSANSAANAASAIVRATPVVPTTKPSPRASPSTEPEWLHSAGEPDVLVYPPRDADATRAPAAVMLHGMCGMPENTCPWFAESVARKSWLVCPRGTARCEGVGSVWQWKDNASFVDAAVKRVAAAHPGAVDDRANGTLIGFSWGALAALDVAQRGDGRWSRLILVAADVHPDAARLARAGVRRVYMGAGNGDMMKAPMMAASDRLVRQGVPAVFVGLGNVGHTFPPDMESWVARAVAWTSADDDAL